MKWLQAEEDQDTLIEVPTKSEKENYQFSAILDTDSDIDTSDPSANEYVQSWGDTVNYALIKHSVRLEKSPFLLAGVHQDFQIGDKVKLQDDGNGTTMFSGQIGTVIARADSPEDITKKFPKGIYPVKTQK